MKLKSEKLDQNIKGKSAINCVRKLSLGSHGKILGGNQTILFGYGIMTIEMFEKKMFQIMCRMMGCNDSSGCRRQRGGGGLCNTYIGHLASLPDELLPPIK